MKKLIHQILGRILTQVPNFEKFSIASKSLALILSFPIVFNGSLPISLPIVALENKEMVKPNGEKVVTIGFDTQNPEAIILIEKQIDITLSESNFDKESALAKAMADMQKLAKRDVIARERPYFTPDPGLAQKRALAQAAAARFGIDWKILEAVWQVESGKSWDTSKTSYAGATGPMQFLPSTFRKYGLDGNGDGIISIYSAYDSVYAAANLLASAGAATGDVERALFAYNHSYSYVQKVLRVARSIEY
jgi:hypothetical protein